ncbi:hypothetical protein SAMN05444487_11738 [Marininema mesophilum]|uniref:Amidohydrolase 3 domain-containing protein n=1 Tax=Marininema mesophilum TaxID=1048340 RepID=A0A1H3BKM4_9BACL|nr:amidohydrolase [Marininema mesophilum]SDX42466.1 hypothetical protein SAMN05444487_11738 [Marininema mesophilum]
MEKRLFVKGNIFTLDKRMPKAEAVYIEGGKIQAIGSSEELSLQFGRVDVEVIHLEGRYVYPGLTDNHLHLLGHGIRLSCLDFAKESSKNSMLRRVREWVELTPPGQWILGLNWDEHRMKDGGPPLREELDRIAPMHPVMLTRSCHHVQAVNTCAIKAAGLAMNAPDPSDGVYGRDEHGYLNGLVYENASQPFRDAIPPVTFAEKKEWANKAARDALSYGITAVHTEDLRDAGSVRELVRIYRELIQEGVFLRSHHLIYHPFFEELIEAGLSAGNGDEWFRIGAMKIFADGSFGGRTARLSTPYADDSSTLGISIHSQEEMRWLFRKAHEHDMPVAVHAIGDGAANQVVEVLEQLPTFRGRRHSLPNRLIHAQVLSRELFTRIRQLPLVVDIQPRFVASDFPWVVKRLGERRLPFAYAWKSLIASGIPCGGGSDAPIEPINPLLGLHTAITRRDPYREDHPGWIPEQKLTPLEALHLFTWGGATTVGEQGERGSITPGKWADLSIFDRDLLGPDPDTLLETKAIMTVVNGHIAWRDEGSLS